LHPSSLSLHDALPICDDVALGPAVSVPLVVRPQAVLDRAARNLLQLRIQGRGHREAALVERLRAVLALEMLADFFDEERRDARRSEEHTSELQSLTNL